MEIQARSWEMYTINTYIWKKICIKPMILNPHEEKIKSVVSRRITVVSINALSMVSYLYEDFRRVFSKS
jgi:hypothetical protein